MSLADSIGRSRLVDTVWGPPSTRRQVANVAKVGASGGSAFAGLEACGGGCEALSGAGEIGAAIGVILLVVAAVGVIFWLGWKLVMYLERRAARPRPFGAELHAAPMPASSLVGEVVAQATGEAPLSGAPCVAYAMVFRSRRWLGGDVMLRDGATSGFEVKLGDGPRVRVPAGRIRLAGPVTKIGDVRDRYRVSQHVARIDPRHDPADPLTPIPFDQVDETLLRPGDRVSIAGPTDSVPDPDAPEVATGTRLGSSSYRAASRRCAW